MTLLRSKRNCVQPKNTIFGCHKLYVDILLINYPLTSIKMVYNTTILKKWHVSGKPVLKVTSFDIFMFIFLGSHFRKFHEFYDKVCIIPSVIEGSMLL